MTQWDFQNKGTHSSPAWLSFVLKVPLRHLRPSVIYSVPCDWILQRAYWESADKLKANSNNSSINIADTKLYHGKKILNYFYLL